MKCPRCGEEIPFYDIRPNCTHCGVNIYYYSQDANLIRDAKRTELESASARMVVARIKATFIGGKLQITRMVFVLLAVAALLVPFGSAHYTVPYFDQTVSVGIIGLVQGFMDGILLKLPDFLVSTMFAAQTIAAAVMLGFMLIIVIIDVVIFVEYLLSFLNIPKGTALLKRSAVAGMVVSLAAQAASIVLSFAIPDGAHASYTFGFGGLAAFAMFLVLFILNKKIERKGIEPVYREYDLRRKELLKKVRAGEVNLDDLPLPVFESEEEHQARMEDLRRMLEAEGEKA